MSLLRRFFVVLAVAGALFAVSAAPAMAVVGGDDAEPGEYPSVAEITFGPFLCTGTLIAPNWVLSAGHCGSVTGGAVASPASWPAPLINVRIGGLHSGEGEQVPVSRVVLNPNYLATSGYDISLLQLSQQLDEDAREGRRRGRAQHLAGRHARRRSPAGAPPRRAATRRHPPGGPGPDHDRRLLRRRPTATSTPQTMVCAGYPRGRRRHLPGRLRRPAVRRRRRRAPRRRRHELRRGLRASRASRASTPAWPTRCCASGSARRRRPASTEPLATLSS